MSTLILNRKLNERPLIVFIPLTRRFLRYIGIQYLIFNIHTRLKHFFLSLNLFIIIIVFCFHYLYIYRYQSKMNEIKWFALVLEFTCHRPMQYDN